jgi:hypothetical protein
MKQSTISILIALTLIVLGVTLRILPHPPNFAPITAIAIFGGAILPRRLGLWVPLGAMIVSDSIIGFYNLIPVTWGCYLLIALASSLWLKKFTLTRGALVTLSSSAFFFVVTNFAVWVAGGIYPHTYSGLVRCYTLAIPFFRNSLLSDAIYTAGLFGVYALATQASYKALAAHQTK